MSGFPGRGPCRIFGDSRDRSCAPPRRRVLRLGNGCEHQVRKPQRLARGDHWMWSDERKYMSSGFRPLDSTTVSIRSIKINMEASRLSQNTPTPGPPCCQVLATSLISESRNHGQTIMVLITCREELARMEARAAILEAKSTRLAAENLRLSLALGHLVR